MPADDDSLSGSEILFDEADCGLLLTAEKWPDRTGQPYLLPLDWLLLDFTLTQVGRGIEVLPKPVDLHELVADCLDELSLAFPGHELTQLRFWTR
ncbi:hypothetical protein ACFS4T_15175 [Pseudomonas lini]